MSVPLFGRVWKINVEFVYPVDHTRRVPRSTCQNKIPSTQHRSQGNREREGKRLGNIAKAETRPIGTGWKVVWESRRAVGQTASTPSPAPSSSFETKPAQCPVQHTSPPPPKTLQQNAPSTITLSPPALVPVPVLPRHHFRQVPLLIPPASQSVLSTMERPES